MKLVEDNLQVKLGVSKLNQPEIIELTKVGEVIRK